MSQVLKSRWEFKAPNGIPSACQLQVNIFRAVIVVTELPDNPGMSITNAAEAVATQAAFHFGIPWGRLVYIEHLQAGRDGSQDPETWDWLQFWWKHNPTGPGFMEAHSAVWHPIDRHTAEALYGDRLLGDVVDPKNELAELARLLVPEELYTGGWVTKQVQDALAGVAVTKDESRWL